VIELASFDTHTRVRLTAVVLDVRVIEV